MSFYLSLQDTIAMLATRISDQEREKEKLTWNLRKCPTKIEDRNRITNRLDEIDILLTALKGNLKVKSCSCVNVKSY